jgi:hypothetical protein
MYSSPLLLNYRGTTVVSSKERLFTLNAFNISTNALRQTQLSSQQQSISADKLRQLSCVRSAVLSSKDLLKSFEGKISHESLVKIGTSFFDLARALDLSLPAGKTLQTSLSTLLQRFLFYLNEVINRGSTPAIPLSILGSHFSAFPGETQALLKALEVYEAAAGLQEGSELQESIQTLKGLSSKLSGVPSNAKSSGPSPLPCLRLVEVKELTSAFVSISESPIIAQPKPLSKALESLASKFFQTLVDMTQDEANLVLTSLKSLINTCLSFLSTIQADSVINSSSSVNLPQLGARMVKVLEEIIDDRYRQVGGPILPLYQPSKSNPQSFLPSVRSSCL